MSNNGTTIAASTYADRSIPDLRVLWIGPTLVTLNTIGLWLYEFRFGWSTGLDSFSPEFQTHWMTVLEGSTIVLVASALAAAGYIWRGRDRNLADLEPREEVRRIIKLVQILVIFSLMLFAGLSFFTEQTAVWHMTAVRDTDFTPSNIITFYIAYPCFAFTGLLAFLYAKTRIPFFAAGYSLPFVILAVGSFMLIPNVAFNEWGHTFWSMDEGFAGPLHWGFVFFGWMTLGVFGVVLQMLGILRKLL